MSDFKALIKFTAKEDGRAYFAPVEASSKQEELEVPNVGALITAFPSMDDLSSGTRPQKRTVDKLLAPVPSAGNSIYCVGLNYRSHAKEANLQVPKYPPLWTKPASSLANPGESIPINVFCALSMLDFEGELVFVTRKACKDVTPDEADDYILGYTIGNDLSCRYFQLSSNSGGQFFFAKAFDKFAPIGPLLLSTKEYNKTANGRKLQTRVNGKVVQHVELAKDMIFSPAQILSHMSQGTTIPAGTAVMTGTPAGVGAFQSPKSFLMDRDVVEVELDGLGTLRSIMNFEK